MYKYKAIKLMKEAGRVEIMVHERDAMEMGVIGQDRVKITSENGQTVAVVERTTAIVEPGTVAISLDGFPSLRIEEGAEVKVELADRPKSIGIIKRKMNGQELSKDEIETIVHDITVQNLTDIELSAYVTANYIKGMTIKETTYLANAMVDSGETIDFDRKPVFDFHSVGGSPGNKVTMLVVPIVAAAGLMIPKTSSRAISSACGTADIFETIAPVCLTGQNIKKIAEEVGGTIVWGGGMNIAPADDIIIRVEYPLSIDPHAQLLASVLAKKKAVGAEYVLIDIPMGAETKVPDEDTARKYARDFIDLGERMGMKIECAITYGGQPVGRAVGPRVEAKEALMALEGGDAPNSLIEKSVSLAGILLEMGGIRNGRKRAEEILESGQALRKLREIIEAQGGDPSVTSESLEEGEEKAEIFAQTDGYVKAISNHSIVRIARESGAPKDKGAGVIITKKEGMQVERGDLLFTIYADNKGKLERAVRFANRRNPYTIEGMVLARIPSIRMENY